MVKSNFWVCNRFFFVINFIFLILKERDKANLHHVSLRISSFLFHQMNLVEKLEFYVFSENSRLDFFWFNSQFYFFLIMKWNSQSRLWFFFDHRSNTEKKPSTKLFWDGHKEDRPGFCGKSKTQLFCSQIWIQNCSRNKSVRDLTSNKHGKKLHKNFKEQVLTFWWFWSRSKKQNSDQNTVTSCSVRNKHMLQNLWTHVAFMVRYCI